MILPKDFTERTKPLLGEEWEAFASALDSEAPISIRLNTNKFDKEQTMEQVPWCGNGYYLATRPQFTFDPLLHAGAYYVQEASSMFVSQAFDQLITGDMRVLDLCAAPGGKSTLISSLLSKDSLLVSNEIIRNRANILAENLQKWGNPNHVVANNRPEDYAELRHFFDVLVVDAPCSGEGMFRKDGQAIDEWSVENVKLCADRQKSILAATWRALKPGGYLFYSTCTYNREENEEIVEWLCDEYNATVVELNINENWGITESEVGGKSTYHFYPHKTKGEGFYFAVLQKSAEERTSTAIFYQKKEKKKLAEVQVSAEYKKYLTEERNFDLLEYQGQIYAFETDKMHDSKTLLKHLNVFSLGICMGQMKGKDFIPHQSLALSRYLNRDSFVVEEVEWQLAISYLRSEAIALSNVAKGYVLLTYRNIPLGFVKNLGNRANNLYPNEWRIRSGNVPANEVRVLL